MIDDQRMADLTHTAVGHSNVEPPPNWQIFTRLWVAERTRKGLPATWNRLAVAVHRASGLEYAIAIPIARACLRHHHDEGDPA